MIRKGFSSRWQIVAVMLLLVLLWFARFSTFTGAFWGDTNRPHIIISDGHGYYGYLPALFIYNDPSYSFFPELHRQYYFAEGDLTFTNTYKDTVVNKYYPGVAVLQLPFFLLAHAHAAIHGALEADGYCWPYQYALLLAAWCYLALGLIAVQKILGQYRIRGWLAFFLLFALAAGTNLWYYGFYMASMSHVYSFCLIAWWSWLIIRGPVDNKVLRYWIAIGLLTGLIFLVRPVNLIVLAVIPFLTGSAPSCVSFLKSIFRPANFAVALAAFLIFPFLLFALYKWQTGDWIVWSYGKEGFNFSDPHPWLFLFSFRKGFFNYAPLFLLMIPGVFFLKGVWDKVWFFIFLVILVYILSSWHNWYYGDSFGMRPMIDFYSILLIPVAILLREVSSIPRTFLVLCIGFFIFLNQVQAFQYRFYIMHNSEMDYDRYKEIFLRTADSWKGIYYKHNDEVWFERNQRDTLYSFTVPGSLPVAGEWQELTLTELREDVPGESYVAVTFKVKGEEGEPRLIIRVGEQDGTDCHRTEKPFGRFVNGVESVRIVNRLGLDCAGGKQLNLYIYNPEKLNLEISEFRADIIQVKPK